ncbi:hypothetical protein CLOM_g2688 [Closterium sp. NIES-68]|nr:hypothetical protein CLOM_g2688 [Closterium sp. NIES-68]
MADRSTVETLSIADSLSGKHTLSDSEGAFNDNKFNDAAASSAPTTVQEDPSHFRWQKVSHKWLCQRTVKRIYFACVCKAITGCTARKVEDRLPGPPRGKHNAAPIGTGTSSSTRSGGFSSAAAASGAAATAATASAAAADSLTGESTLPERVEMRKVMRMTTSGFHNHPSTMCHKRCRRGDNMMGNVTGDVTDIVMTGPPSKAAPMIAPYCSSAHHGPLPEPRAAISQAANNPLRADTALAAAAAVLDPPRHAGIGLTRNPLGQRASGSTSARIPMCHAPQQVWQAEWTSSDRALKWQRTAAEPANDAEPAAEPANDAEPAAEPANDAEPAAEPATEAVESPSVSCWHDGPADDDASARGLTAANGATEVAQQSSLWSPQCCISRRKDGLPAGDWSQPPNDAFAPGLTATNCIPQRVHQSSLGPLQSFPDLAPSLAGPAGPVSSAAPTGPAGLAMAHLQEGETPLNDPAGLPKGLPQEGETPERNTAGIPQEWKTAAKDTGGASSNHHDLAFLLGALLSPAEREVVVARLFHLQGALENRGQRIGMDGSSDCGTGFCSSSACMHTFQEACCGSNPTFSHMHTFQGLGLCSSGSSFAKLPGEAAPAPAASMDSGIAGGTEVSFSAGTDFGASSVPLASAPAASMDSGVAGGTAAAVANPPAFAVTGSSAAEMLCALGAGMELTCAVGTGTEVGAPNNTAPAYPADPAPAYPAYPIAATDTPAAASAYSVAVTAAPATASAYSVAATAAPTAASAYPVAATATPAAASASPVAATAAPDQGPLPLTDQHTETDNCSNHCGDHCTPLLHSVAAKLDMVTFEKAVAVTHDILTCDTVTYDTLTCDTVTDKGTHDALTYGTVTHEEFREVQQLGHEVWLEMEQKKHEECHKRMIYEECQVRKAYGECMESTTAYHIIDDWPVLEQRLDAFWLENESHAYV